MLLVLLLVCSLFTCAFGQTFTNTLYAIKNLEGETMIFNIRINGVNLVSGPFTVTQTSNFQIFTFQQELDDIVEIIFTPETSAFPGRYFIEKSFFEPVFNSRATNFFPVNQCTSNSTSCSFKITPINSFPNGVTASVFLNGSATAAIADYGGGAESAAISIIQGDIINVILSGTLGNSEFGMNFVTNDGGQDSTVAWYNQNLATQMIIPIVYFTTPLNGATIYQNTNLPVELVSIPIPNTFNVLLATGGGNVGIQSNVSNQTYSLNDINIQNQQSYILTVRNTLTGVDNYRGLNTITLTGSTTPPTSITFSTNDIVSSYSAGSAVPIRLDSSPNAGSFMVQLLCATLDPAYSVITSNIAAQNFVIPDDFYGNNCVFSVIYPISATNAPSITVTQPVEFSSPTEGESFSFNSQIIVTPSAVATIPNEPITVIQTCGLSEISYNNVVVNVSFNASPPLNYIGQCTFSSSRSDLYEAATPSVTVTIAAQSISFSDPPANSQYPINSQIIVTPSAVATIPGETITVVQTCGSSVINYTNIAVNTSFNAVPPLNYVGPCTFSSLATAVYEAADPTVTIIINNIIFFVQVPTQLINTQPSFVARISSLGVPATGTNTVDLQLNCNSLGQVESWSSVALNSAVTLSLDKPDITGGPYRCTLSTTATSTYASISSTLTLLTQITPAELSAFVQANGLTPAAGWIV